MGITKASALADFGSGIGTDGSILKVDQDNQRIGIGTTNPQATLQVGTSIQMSGTAGIITAVTATFSGTGAVGVNKGTTAERPGSPTPGMIRYNTQNQQFEGYGTSSWGSLGGASGAGGDSIFYENGQTVTTDYTISTSKNAMSAGPVGIATGITVTIPSGSTWTIV